MTTDAEKQEAKDELSKRYDDVMDTKQMTEQFQVESFLAPFVMVRRKLDGKRGTLRFTHQPRFYFDFMEE